MNEAGTTRFCVFLDSQSIVSVQYQCWTFVAVVVLAASYMYAQCFSRIQCSVEEYQTKRTLSLFLFVFPTHWAEKFKGKYCLCLNLQRNLRNVAEL